MDLCDLIDRNPVPVPWTEGENIPWHEPAFSERMLREHLAQDHDLASRRFEKIDAHVAWIHDRLLQGRPGRILDLACGPGLYTSRLARLGHECMGIDFSPASVAYASDTARRQHLQCRYILDDIRSADYGADYDLVMFVYGEFNVFRPADVRLILRKSYRALVPGGALLLEPSTFEATRQEGARGASWYSALSGLFSAQPHLCLTEHMWDGTARVATTRHFIVDPHGQVTRHAVSYQAYTDAEYRTLLETCGLEDVAIFPSLTGRPDESHGDFLALVGHKPR